MQILSTLTERFRVKAQEAVSSFSLTFVSSWVEYSGPTIENPELVPGSLFGTFDDTAFVILVNTPTSGNQRQVKFISIYNQDLIPHICEFCINTAGTQIEFRFTLQAGDTLFYSDTRGWYTLDENGNTKIVPQSDGSQISNRIILSNSTSGRPIAIAATATPGTLIHSHSGNGIDEVWIWVTNRTATAATLTIEWGGTGSADQLTQALSIPANSSPILIVAGEVIQGNLNIRAFSGTTNALNVSGFVNRLTV